MDEGSIMIGVVVLILLGGGIAVLFWKKRTRVMTLNICRERRSGKERRHCDDKSSVQKKVRIRVMRNTHCQINIYCYDLEEEKMGELLAEYTWENGFIPEKRANAVHLEQIFVQRKQRKKGIGKLMFSYLIREMHVLEQQFGREFSQIYGEVGRDGMDEPRSSIPFYMRMEKLPYGERKRLSLQLKKGAALDGLDVFTYYIVSK